MLLHTCCSYSYGFELLRENKSRERRRAAMRAVLLAQCRCPVDISSARLHAYSRTPGCPLVLLFKAGKPHMIVARLCMLFLRIVLQICGDALFGHARCV